MSLFRFSHIPLVCETVVILSVIPALHSQPFPSISALTLGGKLFLPISRPQAGPSTRLSGRWPTEGPNSPSRDPTPTNDDIAIVKHHGLAGRDGALRLVEGHRHRVIAAVLDGRAGWLVAMTNLGLYPHRLA